MNERERNLNEELHGSGEIQKDYKYSQTKTNQNNSQDNQQSNWDKLKDVPFAGEKQKEQNQESTQEMEQGMYM